MTEYYTNVEVNSATLDNHAPYALEHDAAFWAWVEDWQQVFETEQHEATMQLVLPLGEGRGL